MKQTNVLERTTSPNEVEVISLDPEYVLNVALICQDAPTRRWAAEVFGQVTQLVGEDAVRSTWWEISRLSDPQVFMNAVLTVMRADVILISIHDAKELPVNLCVWIDAWLPRRRLPTGALIALVSVPGQSDVQTDHTRDYLRAVAHKGQLDFLLRERRLPVTSRGFFYMERTKGAANHTTSLFREALSHDHNCYAIGAGFQSQQSNQNLCPPNQTGERPDPGSLRIRAGSAAPK